MPPTLDMNRGNGFPFEYPGIEERFDSGFGSGCSYNEVTAEECYHDIEVLQRNKEELLASGVYFPELNSISARSLLKDSPAGTFLVRDSSDSNYLFSLTVKTEQGATSVRILYHRGLFLFDSDAKIRDKMPRFESVMGLIDHHVNLSRLGGNRSWRWEDSTGKKTVPVELIKPIQKTVSSLSHLCTVKINQYIYRPDDPRTLYLLLPHIDSTARRLLEDYPFKV